MSMTNDIRILLDRYLDGMTDAEIFKVLECAGAMYFSADRMGPLALKVRDKFHIEVKESTLDKVKLAATPNNLIGAIKMLRELSSTYGPGGEVIATMGLKDAKDIVEYLFYPDRVRR